MPHSSTTMEVEPDLKDTLPVELWWWVMVYRMEPCNAMSESAERLRARNKDTYPLKSKSTGISHKRKCSRIIKCQRRFCVPTFWTIWANLSHLIKPGQPIIISAISETQQPPLPKSFSPNKNPCRPANSNSEEKQSTKTSPKKTRNLLSTNKPKIKNFKKYNNIRTTTLWNPQTKLITSSSQDQQQQFRSKNRPWKVNHCNPMTWWPKKRRPRNSSSEETTSV